MPIPPPVVSNSSSSPTQLPEMPNKKKQTVSSPMKTDWWGTKSFKTLEIGPESKDYKVVVTITTYSQNIFHRMLGRISKKDFWTVSSSPVYLIPSKLLKQFEAGGLTIEQKTELERIGVIRAKTDIKLHILGEKTLSYSKLSKKIAESPVVPKGIVIPTQVQDINLTASISEPTVISQASDKLVAVQTSILMHEEVVMSEPKATNDSYQLWIDAHTPNANARLALPEAPAAPIPMEETSSQDASAEKAKRGVNLLVNCYHIGSDFVRRLKNIIKQNGWSNPSDELRLLRNSVLAAFEWNNTIFDRLQACLKSSQPLISNSQNPNSPLFLRDELRAFSAVYFNETLTLSLHSSAIKRLDDLQRDAEGRLLDLLKVRERLKEESNHLMKVRERLVEPNLRDQELQNNQAQEIPSNHQWKERQQLTESLKGLEEMYTNICNDIRNYETLLNNITRVKQENGRLTEIDRANGIIEPKNLFQ